MTGNSLLKVISSPFSSVPSRARKIRFISAGSAGATRGPSAPHALRTNEQAANSVEMRTIIFSKLTGMAFADDYE